VQFWNRNPGTGVAGFIITHAESNERIPSAETDADVPYGPGMMGGNGYNGGMMGAGFGRGMMGQGAYEEVEGPLHDYMSQAIADEFGLTVEELDALHDSGETLWDYAQEQGISQEEFFSRMQAARSEALQAVADGSLLRTGGLDAGSYGSGHGLRYDGTWTRWTWSIRRR
jgi:predicted DNA-binding protein (UPF0251 family)